MTPFRCAVASTDRQEPLFATASRVDRWLLVEHCNAWSAEVLPRFRLEAVLPGLEQLARRSRARLLLIRRPGGASETARHETGRQLFFADSEPGAERLVTRSVSTDPELASVQPPDLQPEQWRPATEPLLLVCTHGRHDPCCAIWGRPVANALAARYPAETWECSHVGGDRFAPNLVVLPQGYYFARVPPDDAADVVARLSAGRLATGYLRGRSALPLPVQAAQYFARTTLGNDDAADLAPVETERRDDGSWLVRLRLGATGEVAVGLAQATAPPHQLTCHSSESRRSPVWKLLDLSCGAR